MVDRVLACFGVPGRMDCLHPSISQRLSPLVSGISPERRQAVLTIAREARSWREFMDVLQRGQFPLPTNLPSQPAR